MSLVGELVGSGERQKTPGGVSSSLGGYTRRTFDIVIATAGIGLFAPIFILTAIAIKLEFRGPIFIRKSLFGYGGRVVGAYKFRFVTYREGSPSLTRVGRLINHTGIEGLPQLFNVLLGEMSIVGPRLYVDSVDDFPQANLMSGIKPGILDWAGPTQFRTTEQRINDDLFYAAKRSHYLDIKVILAALFAEKVVKLDAPFVRRDIVQVQKRG